MQRADAIMILKDAKAFLMSQCGVQLLGLVGSSARNEMTEKSDIDVVYQRAEGHIVTLIDISRARRILMTAFDRNVDMIDWTAVKPHYKKHMHKDLVRLDG